MHSKEKPCQPPKKDCAVPTRFEELHDGDRMTQVEFHRRYLLAPKNFQGRVDRRSGLRGITAWTAAWNTTCQIYHIPG